MERDRLKEQLFKLSYALDSQSAGKDYAALRNTHYENIQWIKENGYAEEYSSYLFKMMTKADVELQESEVENGEYRL